MKKRKFFSIAILLVAIVSALLPVCSALENTAPIEVVPTSELDLYITLVSVRVYANSDGSGYIETFNKGTVVLLTGYVNNYAQVEYYHNGEGEKIVGYFKGPHCPRGGCYYTTAVNGLNLRDAPSTITGNIICTIPYNTFVYIASGSFPNGWGDCTVLEGSYHGERGYVSEDYVAKYDGIYDWWYNHNK